MKLRRILLPWISFLFALLCLPNTAIATMTTTFQISGNVGYEFVGFGQASLPNANGTVTLTQLPISATVLQAFVYSNDFSPGGGFLDASITDPQNQQSILAAGAPPNTSSPVPISQVFGYQFGATNAITTTGNYNITLAPSFVGGNANQISGAGLLVIYQDASLPQATITVADGVELLGGSITSASHTFQDLGGMIGAGAGTLGRGDRALWK